MGKGRRYTKSTNYCLEMVEGFKDLLDDLQLSEEYAQRGRQIANRIFDVLRRNLSIVDRVKIAGSIGKGTGISYYKDDDNEKNSDFDLVVYLNGEKPPFDNILETIKDLLEEHIPELRGEIVRTNISLQFTYHEDQVGEIEFDLLPAENHVKHHVSLEDNEDVGDRQAKIGLEKLKRAIRRNGGKVTSDINRMHSTSFCEKSMDFIRGYIERDEFYRDVIILAKYWIKMLDLEWYVSARSYMTEIIAIDSQKGKSRKCIIAGFRRFLEAMADFRNLYVDIGGVGNNREDDPYFKQVIDGNRPIILTPVNPYNNLADGIKRKVVRTLMSQARRTINMLEENTSVHEDDVENVIDDIFDRK